LGDADGEAGWYACEVALEPHLLLQVGEDALDE
jgi:hypothetical protein